MEEEIQTITPEELLEDIKNNGQEIQDEKELGDLSDMGPGEIEEDK